MVLTAKLLGAIVGSAPKTLFRATRFNNAKRIILIIGNTKVTINRQ
jgi:hypothetical protein